MSAADKLKALEFGRAGYSGVGHTGDETIISALPELIAVVELAEKAHYDPYGLFWLTALGESLRALTAKLGGDET